MKIDIPWASLNCFLDWPIKKQTENGMGEKLQAEAKKYFYKY